VRAALTALLLAAAAPAAAGSPLSLAERQVVTLEFDRPVQRLTITDPDLLSARSSGTRVSLTALKAGRATLEVIFADGAVAAYDVAVEGARRTEAARAAGANDIVVAVAQEHHFRAPGAARVLLEENGVARVSVQGETVSVVGLRPGQSSLVVVYGGGGKTTYLIRVQ
jgi:hypothetical protein